jgi:hypothetical protein
MTLVLSLVISTTRLSIPATHAHVSANPNPTTLLSHGTTECCALLQARKLLGAEDGKVDGLDLHPEVEGPADCLRSIHLRVGRVGIHVLVLLGFLVQDEVQPVASLVAN